MVVKLVVDLDDVVKDEEDERDAEKSPRDEREREKLFDSIPLVFPPVSFSLLPFPTLDYCCNPKNQIF